MLIDMTNGFPKDPILVMIASISGRSASAVRLAEGVYEIGHFGSSTFMSGFEHYPEDLEINCYGVCDNYQQILDQCPELNNPRRKFTITLTKIEKSEEPSDGGWRWHKWGPYIGVHEPTTEYLHDEPLIDMVYVYHIYEKVS